MSAPHDRARLAHRLPVVALVLVAASLPLAAPAGAGTADGAMTRDHGYHVTLTTAESQYTPGVDNQGWWSNVRANDDDNDSYLLGRLADGEVRNFFTFHVGSLNGSVVSATLKLQRGSSCNSTAETFSLFAVATPAASLNDNQGTNETIFDDLGSGPVFGTYTVPGSGPASEVLSFPLNARGVQGVANAVSGSKIFSVGGALATIDAELDCIFDGSEAQQLEVVMSMPVDSDKVNPDSAFDGTNTMVVWQDARNGEDDVYASRVDQSGNVLDPGGIPITTAHGDQQNPQVAWNGSTYLVTWQDRRSDATFDIYGTRLAPNGVVRNPGGLPVSTAAGDQTAPSVAASGSTFLVVWQDGRNATAGDTAELDIYSTRVTGTGTVQNVGGVAVSTAAKRQLAPFAASNGSGWLVAWTDRRTGRQADIYGTRVAATGVAVTPAGVAISDAVRDQSNPSIAWNGSVYLVTWSDYRSGTSLDIYGSRVSPTGGVLDGAGIGVSVRPEQQADADVAAVGSQFLVVWGDLRSASTLDVYSTRVSSGGRVLNPSGVIVSNAANHQTMPTVSRSGADYITAWGDLRTSTASKIYGSRIGAGGTTLTPSGTLISG